MFSSASFKVLSSSIKLASMLASIRVNCCELQSAGRSRTSSCFACEKQKLVSDFGVGCQKEVRAQRVSPSPRERDVTDANVKNEKVKSGALDSLIVCFMFDTHAYACS